MIATHDSAAYRARLLKFNPTLLKLHMRKLAKIEWAKKSGMLDRTDDQGRPLYRMTAGGNIVRTRPIRQHMKKRILLRDGHACVECGSTERLEIAHVEAYRVNGNNDDANLRTLCADCHNLERGN